MKLGVLLILAALVVFGCGPTTQGGVQSDTARPAVSSQARALFGDQLTRASGASVSPSVLGGKIVGIYFSAHWCGPCRQFTPTLVETYKKLVAAGKPFEIVFVSSDNTQADMYSYMKRAGMPWLAVPFRGAVANTLKSKYSVRGIPTLVVVDQEGNTLTTSGRAQVMSLREKAWERWIR